MATRRDEDWNEVPGFMPLVSHWMPAEHFDQGPLSRPYQHLLAADTCLGRALSHAWRQMQLEVRSASDGPLSLAAAFAGVG